MSFKKFFAAIAIVAATAVSFAALAWNGKVSVDGSGSAVKVEVLGGVNLGK